MSSSSSSCFQYSARRGNKNVDVFVHVVLIEFQELLLLPLYFFFVCVVMRMMNDMDSVQCTKPFRVSCVQCCRCQVSHAKKSRGILPSVYPQSPFILFFGDHPHRYSTLACDRRSPSISCSRLTLFQPTTKLGGGDVMLINETQHTKKRKIS